MKALQSDLARKVLADKRARTQLRSVVSDARQRTADSLPPETIVLQDGARLRRLTAVVVPKAA